MIQMVLLVVVQVFLSIGGMYKIKTASGILETDFMLGFGCYAASFIVWVFLLRIYPVSIVFPLAIGVNLVATQILGIYILGEKYGWVQLLAVGLIVLGVILLSVAEKKTI